MNAAIALEESLASRLENACEFPVTLRFASQPISVMLLSKDEKRLLRRYKSRRQESWLRGRAALKDLFRTTGENEDTASICFPNARFSLSHSGPLAAAVGVEPGKVRGLGVDLELRRMMKRRSAHFFLTAEERLWVEEFEEPLLTRHLLRLWSIKEALFKANVMNKGTSLRQYAVLSPELDFGPASGPAPKKETLRYASFEFEQGFFSLAFLP